MKFPTEIEVAYSIGALLYFQSVINVYYHFVIVTHHATNIWRQMKNVSAER